MSPEMIVSTAVVNQRISLRGRRSKMDNVVAIWKAVVIFPIKFGLASTFPFVTKNKISPPTMIKSLNKIVTTTQTGGLSGKPDAKITPTYPLVTSNLSARGSKNLPRCVTWCFILASKPSSASVKLASKKRAKAQIRSSGRSGV